MENNDIDKEKEKDETKNTTRSIFDTLEIMHDVTKTKNGARFKNDGTIINPDLPEDDSILDAISQAFSSATDSIAESDISKIAGDVISGIGDAISDIDL